MIDAAILDLEEIGREAAREVAGEDAVGAVEVRADYAFDRPIYRFTYLIHSDRARLGPGLLLPRLTQHLIDVLEARDDARYPVVRILGPDGWARSHRD